MSHLALLVAGHAVVGLPAWPVAPTEHGDVRGAVELLRGTSSFLGIPFASPPVGDLRWRPPLPPKPWSAARTATSWPPMCVQDLLSLDVPALVLGQEDCLYLNVFVPKTHRPLAALPVIVWIYGGGFTIGDGHEFGFYDGHNLAKAHDSIVVTFNYRVGVFGFMSLPQLMEESGTVGNQAMQDQRLALEWVQRNIANFGGDPHRVAISGESAVST
eukprot:COSAG01_NODE_1290_length_10882_cov_25.926922_8_plen_215_part_00